MQRNYTQPQTHTHTHNQRTNSKTTCCRSHLSGVTPAPHSLPIFAWFASHWSLKRQQPASGGAQTRDSARGKVEFACGEVLCAREFSTRVTRARARFVGAKCRNASDPQSMCTKTCENAGEGIFVFAFAYYKLFVRGCVVWFFVHVRCLVFLVGEENRFSGMCRGRRNDKFA